ncbi:MAG: flagellar biosynthesis protein FlhF [Bryobacteraceae bacterium]|jgi:flagellar biosynthesis protein FlhF
MKIKSYFARTVEDAMAEARREMGPDAMLVNSRKAPPEARDLGEYEVVFAADTVSAAAGAPPAAGQPGLAAPAPGDRLSLEVAELKRELENMRRALARSAFTPSQWTSQTPYLSEAYATLTANEVDPELARDIVQGAAARAAEDPAPLLRAVRRLDRADFERALTDEIGSRVTVEPLLGRGETRPRIVALVGPPGCGKTTTLVKLAVNYGLAGRRPALLLSADTYRVAAAEQLRSYAAILGIGFQVLETVAALSQAIEENRGKDVIFIDTPGFGYGDMDQASSLARFLASRDDLDAQLVLPSSMKSADLARVVDSYRSFRPQRLLFTKLDETSSFGPILNEAARTGRPLSFFTAGQRIPEDLETASRERVSELVLTGRIARAQSAA